MTEMEKLSDKYLDRDMGYEWSGTSLQEKQSAGQIGPILAMALTFVYLFLVALYESWTLPIAVMLISPVALVGALFFQYVSGYALDIYAQIGLVMLVGLGTKQAILIVEFAKDAMEKDGMNYIDAASEIAFQSRNDDKHCFHSWFVTTNFSKRCWCRQSSLNWYDSIWWYDCRIIYW